MKTSHKPGDVYNVLDTLEDTSTALKAFSAMLELALDHNADNLAPHGYGIHILLNRKADDLDDIKNVIRREVDRLQDTVRYACEEANAAKQELARIIPAPPPVPVDDVKAISRASGVHEGAVARVLFVLTGNDFAGDAYKREGEFGTYRLDRHLMERRVHDVLNKEVEWGRVIDETGLGYHKMQEVFHSMLKVSPELAAELMGEKPKPADLRKEIIADKLKEGVDAGQIAQALNMKRATVERVIGQLMAEQPHPDPDRKAVNG